MEYRISQDDSIYRLASRYPVLEGNATAERWFYIGQYATIGQARKSQVAFERAWPVVAFEFGAMPTAAGSVRQSATPSMSG